MGTTNVDALAVSGIALNPNEYQILTHYIAGTQTAAAKKVSFLVPFAATIADVRAYLDTAPTGAAFVLDVNLNGTTVFTTQGNRPTIAISGNASTTTLPDVVSVAAGDRITVDVDVIGSSVAGSDLSIAIALKRQHPA